LASFGWRVESRSCGALKTSQLLESKVMVKGARSSSKRFHGIKETPSRIRLQDIADMTGVGIATVDRVLNERGNVSSATAEKVLAVARPLELKRILPSSHRRLLRIEVILARPELPLIGRMNREFAKLAERVDRSIVIQRTVLKSEDPRLLANHIRETKCDAVVVYAQEHDEIHAAVGENFHRGVPVLTMISDLPNSARLAYVGTDHYSAGRTAGFFMARMIRRPGPVIVLCSHFAFQSHEQRVTGFRDALAKYASELRIAEVLEGGDESKKPERLLTKAFKSNPDIVGLYNVGAANDAVATALRAGNFAPQPIFIGHELTFETRPMLLEGLMTMAIDQNPEHQARFAMDVLLHHFGYTDHTWLEVPYRSNIAFRLCSPENIIGAWTRASPG
jgi:LacI family transcriptional regulator